MNMITLPLIRAAALAAALVTLSAAGYAGESQNPAEDQALKAMHLNGWIPVERVSVVRVGSPVKVAFGELGPADRYLSDGTWLIYKDFHVEHSGAHGILVVSCKDGRVSAMRLVSPAVAVELAANRADAVAKVIVASNR
jgi:hypothetical protein